MIENIGDFRALDPFFRIIEQGLAEFVEGEHFFDLLAEDVVFDFIITVPNYPRHIVGRDNLIELYRGYGSTLFLDRCYDLRVHPSPSTSSVVLEYSSEGRVVATGQPYSNRYISVVVVKDRKVTAWRDYLDPLRVFAALEGHPLNRTSKKRGDDPDTCTCICGTRGGPSRADEARRAASPFEPQQQQALIKRREIS